ncbi:HPr(Ser) kinase/phosphatase [Spiroplasma platyhelix]|uniref:HPr(Ser) kinase/phosphatase n=1 Tax=Spiroplasma platyhelix PALS-1 TaxID=1276218 RepID=A0A846U0W8_9MOLU|nr:HPr(Ser) kinase/phosphatase [Spiroplasma platyhelix]MBE4704096.1 HPr kinase/phosphorylase [Spiroplasma platyhelix PALS-1]NKE38466.1 HPr(Ser) kinase/phosphatase [Spiroplasma platyhelix PALS-1]UJB29354.1 HPr kinase/phosphorylase [Spiroplasma platyhelix PALS-1]
MKNFTIKNIIQKFDLKVLYQNKNIDLNKILITIPGVNRGGLQLMGFKSKRVSILRRVILLSSTESEYLDTLSSDTYESHFKNILQDHIPAIFVTPNFKHTQKLCKIAEKLESKVVIIQFFGDSSEFANTVTLYIAENLAPGTRIHGTLVNIFGHGVLITGASGIGKSETTLELIRNGHLFIGDDSIEILKINNKIIGRSNEMVKNLIEIRGIGILDVTKMYGYHVVLPESQIQLIIKLAGANSSTLNKIDRLGTNLKFQQYFNVKIPTIKLPVTSGRNLADLITSAVISMKLKEAGEDSAVQFEQEVVENLKNGK